MADTYFDPFSSSLNNRPQLSSAASTSSLSAVSTSGPAGGPSTSLTIDGSQYNDLDQYNDSFGDDGEDEVVSVPVSGSAGDGAKPVVKVKKTRGAAACERCRKLKMRCVPDPIGGLCTRCRVSGHNCVFVESQRGQRRANKTNDLVKSVKHMEAVLENVLSSLGPGAGAPSVSAPLPPDDISSSTPTPPAVPTIAAPMLSPKPVVTGTSEHPAEEGELIYAGKGAVSPSAGLGVPSTTHQPDKTAPPRLQSLPQDSLNPLGLLVESSQQNSKNVMLTIDNVLNAGHGDLDFEETLANVASSKRRGIANAHYFQPGPLNIVPLRRFIIEQRLAPALLTEKICTFAQVVELFDLYFEKCHPTTPLLDPVLHTPYATGTRSPFLFTTICAVASRFYQKRTDNFYQKCIMIARKSAFAVMERGFKSPEICQAILLLVHWNQPSERYEEERAYQFSGIAIRMAQDLNLHRRPIHPAPASDITEATKALLEREILNRERTWMWTYITDRVIACQMGKPYAINKEDSIIRECKKWHLQAQSQETDEEVVAFVDMHRVVTRILDALQCDSDTGLNETLNYVSMVQAFLDQLLHWKEDWDVPSAAQHTGTVQNQTKNSMRLFFYQYYRLLILSFAVEHSKRTPEAELDLPVHCAAAFNASVSLINVVRDSLAPAGFFRFCPDSYFVFVSYACCFLLKLSRPNFESLVDANRAIKSVEDGAQVLSDVAMDDSHTPALYAVFIRDLLASREGQGSDTQSIHLDTTPIPVVPEKVASQSPPPPLENYLVDEFSNHNDLSTLAGLESLGTLDEMQVDGFWDNMLFPGYGTTQGIIAGGHSTGVDPWLFTPFQSPSQSRVQSRATSPSRM